MNTVNKQTIKQKKVIDKQSGRLTVWYIDCVTDWSTDCVTDWLTDWQTDRLPDLV